jgi:GTPase SAR1 family protein
MGYFQPKVIYRDPDAKREDSIIRYIGNRVLKSNKNFLCALVGQVGSGKSYLGLAMCERYSKMFNIPFDPKIHVISSLKELLVLITSKTLEKSIQFGTIILFDEPQVEANARAWQSDINQAFQQLISTFRNQRLIVLFATPFLEMLDKQSRLLFLGEFKVEGYDRNTKITTVKPRFLEYNKKIGDFYRKRLIIEYAVKDKSVHNITKLNFWHVPMASKEIVDVYEEKKKKFTDDLNLKLLNQIELAEKQAEGKNKSEELFKVQELMDKYGENYIKILQEMPHLSPFTVEKYVQFIKKSKKHEKIQNNEEEDKEED